MFIDARVCVYQYCILMAIEEFHMAMEERGMLFDSDVENGELDACVISLLYYQSTLVD